MPVTEERLYSLWTTATTKQWLAVAILRAATFRVVQSGLLASAFRSIGIDEH
jgi:hypothetical protein